MKKLIGLIACIMLLGLSSVFAQSKEVTGTITDMSGLGMPGVSVSIKGTTEGTNTDIDGKWGLTVSPKDVIIVSFVGMKTQEIAVGDKTVINVLLEEDRVAVEEVIVVAYGTAKKKSFTGSASQVKSAKIEAKNVSEISKALTGEVAGVAVIGGSGQPGQNAKIRIRGFGSVNASSAPLYIVDGVPYNGDISAISPSDIASTSVLKDASATAIYGARGANGVIVITTKTGKRGESNIEVETKFGVNMHLLPMHDVIGNQENYLETAWEGIRNKKLASGYKKYVKDGGADDFAAYWTANLEAANQVASNSVFDTDNNGINPVFNMWNTEGSKLIDPSTGKFYSDVKRKYTPDSWEDNMFRTGFRKEAALKMSGGSENTSYFTSVGYLKDEGYYLKSDFSRLNTRLNVNHNVKEWLKGSVNLSYSYMEMNAPGQGSSANNGFNFINNIPSLFPVYERDTDGNKIKDPKLGGNRYDYGDLRRARPFSSGINPAGAIQLDTKKTISHQMTANSMLDAKINDDFSVSTTFGVQTLVANRSNITNPFYGDAKNIGRIYKNNNIYFSFTWNQLLKYNHTFDDIHNVSAFIAHESTLDESKYMYGSKDQMVRSDVAEWNNAVKMGYMNSYIVDYSLESYFAQLKYDYDNKYFLHGTIRRDGSSRFPDNKWGTFGSVGAAWLISSEDFMQDYELVRDLKFKISYGVLGNQSIGNYPTYDQYEVENLNGLPSFKFSSKGNSNLTWEKSKTFNTGLEFSLGEFVDAEFEYFRKTTDNLLFKKRVSPSLGYAMLAVNDGELLNTGIEFNTRFHLLKTDDMSFNIGINGAHYVNEISKMPIETATGKPKVVDIKGIYAYSEGHSLLDFYIREWAGVDSQSGRAQWNSYYYENEAGEKVGISSMEEHYASANGNKKVKKEKTFDYNKATKKYVDKSAIPVVSGAFNLDFSYKNFTLSAQLLYSLGGYSYDYIYSGLMSNKSAGKNNWSTDMNNRWQKPGDIADVPRLSSEYDKNVNSSSTRFLTKNDYLSLNNIQLSYKLPSSLLKKIDVKNASLSISGDNLWLLSKRKGYIPNTSTSGSNDSSGYSPLSTVTVGLKVMF